MEPTSERNKLPGLMSYYIKQHNNNLHDALSFYYEDTLSHKESMQQYHESHFLSNENRVQYELLKNHNDNIPSQSKYKTQFKKLKPYI